MTTVGRGALAEIDLIVCQGADNDYEFRYSTGDPAVPVDLTGWAARAQLRQNRIGDVWLTLTSSDEIVLTADGWIRIHIGYPATDSSDWDVRSSGVWDLELTSPADRRIRFAAGTVTVSHEVTRDA